MSKRYTKAELANLVALAPGWPLYFAIKYALENRGFKERTTASNGSGIVGDFEITKFASEREEALFHRALSKLDLVQNEDGVWENLELHVKFAIVDEGAPWIRPRLLIVTHPDDGKWTEKTLRQWDWLGRTLADQEDNTYVGVPVCGGRTVAGSKVEPTPHPRDLVAG